METEVIFRGKRPLNLLPFSGSGIFKKRIFTDRPTQYDMYVTPEYGIICHYRRLDLWLKPRTKKTTCYLFMKIGKDAHGYKAAYYLEHIEVAKAFTPRRNSFCNQVHHLDMNTTNNVADNLIWVTPREHVHIHKEGARGEYTTMMKVLEEEREFCRDNGIRFERKIDINLLTTKIKKYYESKSRTISHGK